MVSSARQRISPYEYFRAEQESAQKHEYLDGQVWMMAGGTPDHSRIITNIIISLGGQLLGKACQAFESNLRFAVLATGLRTYPDVSVICGALELDPQDHTQTTATNPRVLIEVLSPSTEAYDRGEKLDNYKTIASLEEVALVANPERSIEIWRRTSGLWAHYEFREGSAPLISIACELMLEDVYRNRLLPRGASGR